MSLNIEATIREYIDKSLHLSLATVHENRPWVCEVHFVYDDDLNLYWRSLASRRHSQELAANPHVAGNIVRQHGPGEYPHGIYFEGQAALITDAAERERLAPLFERRQQADPAAILADATKPDGHQFYKVAVIDWYAFGKFGGDSGQKLHLPWGKRL